MIVPHRTIPTGPARNGGATYSPPNSLFLASAARVRAVRSERVVGDSLSAPVWRSVPASPGPEAINPAEGLPVADRLVGGKAATHILDGLVQLRFPPQLRRQGRQVLGDGTAALVKFHSVLKCCIMLMICSTLGRNRLDTRGCACDGSKTWDGSSPGRCRAGCAASAYTTPLRARPA